MGKTQLNFGLSGRKKTQRCLVLVSAVLGFSFLINREGCTSKVKAAKKSISARKSYGRDFSDIPDRTKMHVLLLLSSFFFEQQQVTLATSCSLGFKNTNATTVCLFTLDFVYWMTEKPSNVYSRTVYAFIILVLPPAPCRYRNTTLVFNHKGTTAG